MRAFSYTRATALNHARAASAEAETALLAGGTTLLDLAKCGVADPAALVDITQLPGLSAISVETDGVLVGALCKMSAVADDREIQSHYPAVSQALSLAASAQLRNMATIGGNLLQRTRCSYFRDPATFPACNKRNPGSGCSAIGGITRNHAVLGTSPHCIASYPGDLAVALVALEATVEIGERVVPVEDFFLVPGDTPHLETVLQPGEVITGIRIPASAVASNSLYLKVRDRQSYEFAAASAAVGLELEADGQTVRDIRVAVGGVATRPWRLRAVEQALKGQLLTPEAIEQASRLAAEGALSQGDNSYKIELLPRVVARAILTVGGLA